MKTRSILSLTILTVAFLSMLNDGCGGGSKQPKTAATDTSSYQPAASSAYDPSKIDPTAPVMEVSLQALGNSIDIMSFSNTDINVKSGTTVKIHFQNTATDSAMTHNFCIVKKGTDEQVATEGMQAGRANDYIPNDKTNLLYHSQLILPGQSVDLVFAAPPPGSYDFVCTTPGHWQKMHGNFTVE